MKKVIIAGLGSIIVITVVGVLLVSNLDYIGDSLAIIRGEAAKTIRSSMMKSEERSGSIEKARREADREGLAAMADDKYIPSESSVDNPNLPRKQIFTLGLNIEVKQVDEALSYIESAAEGFNGFVLSSSSYKSGEGKSGSITVKVPPKQLDAFRERVVKIGTVISENLDGQDVSEDYYDTKTRIANAKALESRLLNLMSRAGNVKDLLQVERELARVREKIERLQGKIKYYDARVDLATVNIALFEPTSAVPHKRGLWWIIKTGIMQGVQLFVLSVSLLIIIIIAVLPWAIAYFLFAAIWRRIKRKR